MLPFDISIMHRYFNIFDMDTDAVIRYIYISYIVNVDCLTSSMNTDSVIRFLSYIDDVMDIIDACHSIDISCIDVVINRFLSM